MVRQFLFLLAATLAGALPAHADGGCSRLLVSGYHSTVHVYDGCSGAFVRELDDRGRLFGAQAVRRHGELLYVVAEGLNAIHRYRADTLAFVDTFITVAGDPGITGIAFGPDGDVYLGGYNSDSVLRFDGSTGAPKGEVVGPASGLNGPDNGLLFGPDGKLYIPGFNSHNVLRWDPVSGRSEVFIAARSGGLARTRGILFEPDGSGVLVSSEGSAKILRYRLDGSFDQVLASFPFGPNGMDYASDGSLLVTGFGGDVVLRIDAKTGAMLGTLVPFGSGGLSGATFLTVLPAVAMGVDQAQVGSQYWLTGSGMPQGRRLEIELISSEGTAFGADFDPAAISDRRWGTLSLNFTSCDQAEMAWQSSGPDSAGFGDGGYPLLRFGPTAASQRCQQQGIEQQSGHDWMAGTWFGGSTRSGEGFFIDVLHNGVVIVAFFTHRPAAVAH